MCICMNRTEYFVKTIRTYITPRHSSKKLAFTSYKYSSICFTFNCVRRYFFRACGVIRMDFSTVWIRISLLIRRIYGNPLFLNCENNSVLVIRQCRTHRTANHFSKCSKQMKLTPRQHGMSSQVLLDNLL